jgi:tripartite-type tricarboxylate transporter receptor subunit TctC
MVVINKPGGAGTAAVADMISSKPDGYKIGILDAAYFSTAVKTQKVPFDPSHVIPLNTFLELKLGLKVKGDSPWKTLNDLLDYAKKNPGKLRFGHSGRGLTSYMNTMLVFKKAGVETIDVPYKGAPDAIAALLGGHIDAISQPHGAVKGLIDSKTLRYLVVYSDRRYSDPSDVPDAIELGFPEAAKLMPLLGVWVHKDTPGEVKKILTDTFKKAFEDPEFKKGIEKIGDEPRFGGPEKMMELIKIQEEVSVPVLKELGIYVGN